MLEEEREVISIEEKHHNIIRVMNKLRKKIEVEIETIEVRSHKDESKG